MNFTEDRPLNIYIGYDSREDVAYEVAKLSIEEHATIPVNIIPLKQKKLRSEGIYTRQEDALASTEFTFTRFLVPYLNDYEGWAIFVDCDFLLNYAAETHVDNSYKFFKKHIDNNIIATQILIESILNYNKKIKLIHFSTDEIYGESNNDSIIFKEDSNFNPTNPYAATKACAELIINTYKYSYNLPIIITRCNNVYGINQHKEKVIPKFISNIIDNKPIEIHGTQNKKRDFIYIDDVISALEIIITNGVDSEIYNIGINNPIYIYDLANIICNKMNKKNHKILRVKDRPFNDYRYNIDNTKLMNIGWKPIFINKNDFEKNLEKIIDNIKNN